MFERTLPTPRPPIPVSSPDYRPRDYFGRYDHQTELLTSVQGYARRQSIKPWNSGRWTRCRTTSRYRCSTPPTAR